MLADVTKINAVRSSTVSTSVSYKSDFKWLQEKKSKGLRAGKRGGQAKDSPYSIHFPGYVAWRWFHNAAEKYAGVPSWMNHIFWYAVACIPRQNSGRSRKFTDV
ncbi:hypothetical protein TNCV_1377401 [Trichonephila clavipes]|nr:hypothetical protein TNCV_1377401 [Trichonephila clavipes]